MLIPGRKYTVGRKDCHILILEDQSISRCHAELIVPSCGEQEEGMQGSPGTLMLRDLSKFGTLVNGCKLEKRNIDVSLKDGDRIKFGSSPASKVFELESAPLVVCCSGMSPTEKNTVSETVGRLGGTLEQSWSKQCVMLVMNRLTVTQKVVSALACCRPVVTAQWLTALADTSSNNKPLPDYRSYLPPIVDRNANNKDSDFHVNVSRKKLFSGKIFYFLSKSQLGTYELCITMCGGRCSLVSPSSEEMDKISIDKNCLFVSMEDRMMDKLPPSERERVLQLYDKLERKDNRRIHDTEVVRAVLHCSVDLYCNPASQTVPHGSPLPPPSLSQASQQMSQFSLDKTGAIGQPVMSSTQLHSQISLLEGRRNLSLDVSASHASQHVDHSTKSPPAPAAPSQVKRDPTSAVKKERKSSVSTDVNSSLSSTLKERRHLLAPDSLPSLPTGTETSASFVISLFPPKRKRSVSEAASSHEISEPSSKKVHLTGKKHEGQHEPELQHPSREDVDKKPVSHGSKEDFCTSTPSTKYSRRDTPDIADVSQGSRNYHVQPNLAGISANSQPSDPSEYSLPTGDQLSSQSAFRRPRRFVEPSRFRSPSSYISTRKTSKAFYHPPVTTDDNVSKILLYLRSQDSQSQTSQVGAAGSYLEEGSRENAEDEDRMAYIMPTQQCSIQPLLAKRQQPSASNTQSSGSAKNYKKFRKVQPLGENWVNRTIITNHQMQCYQKSTCDSFPIDQMELEMEADGRGTNVEEEGSQDIPDSNPFKFISKRKTAKKP